MRVKIGDNYLELEVDIEIEKKIKLFEDIEAAQGDFSYEFEVPLTATNIRILGIPFADLSTKPVYNNIDCIILGEDGLPIYKGYLRIERITQDRKFAFCSFFSGNNSWVSMITGNLSDLDYSKYDVLLSNSNIQNTWTNTSGLVMPVIDSGVVSYRSYRDMVIEDFKGFLFIKEVIRDIFQSAGIKTSGELLTDYRYNNLIITSNDLAVDEVKKRSSYANKTSDQTLVIGVTKILFEDDSTPPFYDGTLGNYQESLSFYAADVKMLVKVDVSILYTLVSGGFATTSDVFYISISKNGIPFKTIGNGQPNLVAPVDDIVNASHTMVLEAGDYIDIRWNFFYISFPNIKVNQGSTFKVTPIFVYKVFGNSILPKWTKREFVTEVLKIFCPVLEFNNNTNTLTINLFNKIKDKTPIDLSEYISEVEVDYIDFINDYGRDNLLSYSSSDIDVVSSDEREIASEASYNNSNELPYGSGTINVDNDFIEQSVPILESKFSAPFSYLNPIFDMSLEKLDLVEQKTNSDIKADIISVTNTGDGRARFNVASDVYTSGDVVRIENSTVDSYNGYWVVFTLGVGYFYCNYVTYNGNATADSVKMDISLSNNSNTYILLKSSEIDMSEYFSSNNELYIGGFFPYSDFSLGYFNMIDNNKEARNKLLLGMSFGHSTNVLQFQTPLIDSYWSVVGRILNDPVKLFAIANIPEKVFRNISFLNPVMIRTKETSNMYYLNRITGYKGSHLPCTLELVKLP